jgi:hypothetical protein
MEKSQLKGISETRIEPDGWSENQWFTGLSLVPVFYGSTGKPVWFLKLCLCLSDCI